LKRISFRNRPEPIEEPTSREDFAALGDRARDERRWSDAVEAYRKHLEDRPTDFGILIQLGNCAKEAKDFATSLNAYSKALELNAADADLNLQLGHLYKVMGRRQNAAKFFVKALQIDGRLVDARRELATLRSSSGSDGEDFSLPENMLDFLKAKSLQELIERAPEFESFGDPFKVYYDLVSR
jgi:tetratricopeptide (TPR) repeat protein